MIQFTNAQTEFLREEFGVEYPPDRPIELERETLWGLHDRCCDVEEEECIRCQEQEELSARGRMAAKISDILYFSEHPGEA